MLCKGCTPRPQRSCAYCGHRRIVVAVWADGPACNSCYRRFLRAKAICPGCGQHRRLLPYPGQPQPVCAPCASAPPGPVCAQCGRCVLADRLTEMLGDADNRTRLGLQPLFDTLVHAEHPETAIGWMRPSASGTAHQLLAQLGCGDIPLSHEALDALNTPGNGGTANHLDAILTAIGALPPRDIELARLERTIPAALTAVADEEQRRTLRGYATWDLLRRARTASRTDLLTAGARHNATTRLAAATHLLGWLARRGLDLAGQQPDLDDYQVEHRNRALSLHGFLAWAHRTRRARKLTLASRPKQLPRTVAAADEHRWALARALLHDDGHTPADRVAGLPERRSGLQDYLDQGFATVTRNRFLSDCDSCQRSAQTGQDRSLSAQPAEPVASPLRWRSQPAASRVEVHSGCRRQGSTGRCGRHRCSVGTASTAGPGTSIVQPKYVGRRAHGGRLMNGDAGSCCRAEGPGQTLAEGPPNATDEAEPRLPTTSHHPDA
jgi:hypothetical protein